MAKLTGHALTVTVLRGEYHQAVPLRRRSKKSSEEEILAVLHPTFAYVEDELQLAGAQADPVRISAGALRRPATAKSSCCAAASAHPEPFNAGLLGYLEAVEN